MKAILALLLVTATAAADCPKPVADAIGKAFPSAKISACSPEKEHGRDQFEVRIVKQDGGKAEVDVAPDGKILQVEEKIALDQLPAAVTKAFAAKYPKAKPSGAEKQTAGSEISYEIAFTDGGKRKEVTFTEGGKLVEEE